METINAVFEMILINFVSVYLFVQAQPLVSNLLQLADALLVINPQILKPFIDSFYILTLAMLNCVVIFYKIKKAKKEK
jgi:hypothetical protein